MQCSGMVALLYGNPYVQFAFAGTSVLLGVLLFVFHFFVSVDVRDTVFMRRGTEFYSPTDPSDKRSRISKQTIGDDYRLEWDYGSTDLFGEVSTRLPPASQVLNFRRFTASETDTDQRPGGRGKRRVSAPRQPDFQEDFGSEIEIDGNLKRNNPLYGHDQLVLGSTRGSLYNGSRSSAASSDRGGKPRGQMRISQKLKKIRESEIDETSDGIESEQYIDVVEDSSSHLEVRCL
jgi:hypothetical protein